MTTEDHDHAAGLDVGWHPDEVRDKYRYWDGEAFVFTASGPDLRRYRELGQLLPRVDVQAPVHGELASEAAARAQGSRRRTLRAAVVVVVVVVVLAVVLAVVL